MTLAAAGRADAHADRDAARLRLTFHRGRDGVTRFGATFAQAPLRAHRVFSAPDGTAIVPLVHVGPGLLAGDRLLVEVHVGPGASAVLVPQSATKVHSMPIGTRAEVDVRAEVADGGRLEFHGALVVPFPDAELLQRSEVDLAADAFVAWTERWCQGRHREGERARYRRLVSTLRVRRGEALVYADRLHLDGAPAADVGRRDAGVLDGHEAFASAVACLPEPIDAASIEPDEGIFDGGRGVYLRALHGDAGALRPVVYDLANRLRRQRGLAPIPHLRYGA